MPIRLSTRRAIGATILIFFGSNLTASESADGRAVGSQSADQSSATAERAHQPEKSIPPIESGIQIQHLSDESLRSLTLTGKVWGFLKYHHPAATTGLTNWDAELFKILPGIISARSQEEVQSILSNWISGLVAIEPCSACLQLDHASLQSEPHLQWIEDRQLLGIPLSEQLESVYLNRRGGKQRYVDVQPGVGSPSFISEEKYPEVHYPDSGYQILAIYRFWNIVEYWYPYRQLLGGSWDSALSQALKAAAPAQDSTSFQRNLIALIAKMRDGHANLWSSLKARPPEGDCQLPLNLRWVQGKLVVESFSSASDHGGALVGDIVEGIDGQTIEELVGSNIQYYVGSNDPARDADIAANIGRGHCGPVKLKIRRAAKSRELDLNRQTISSLDNKDSRRNDRPGNSIQHLNDQTIYLKISSAQPADVPEVFSQAKTARVLVIDLRGYPASAIAQELAARLLDKAQPYVRFTFPDYGNPGAVLWGPIQSIEPVQPRFDGRVVLLVDETTVSSGEFTAMALQASQRVLTAGTQTAGADGNMSAIPLPGGLVAAMSGIGVYYPDGTPTQRIGIRVDIRCPATLAGIRNGKDVVLDCALREVQGLHRNAK